MLCFYNIDYYNIDYFYQIYLSKQLFYENILREDEENYFKLSSLSRVNSGHLTRNILRL